MIKKTTATYHNGVRFYSKIISLEFPDKIKSYQKKMNDKGLVIIKEQEIGGFLYMRYVHNKDKETYLAKPELKVEIKGFKEQE